MNITAATTVVGGQKEAGGTVQRVIETRWWWRGADGSRAYETAQTNDASASFGAVVVSKTDKKIKKNTPRAQTTPDASFGPFFSLSAHPNLRCRRCGSRTYTESDCK